MALARQLYVLRNYYYYSSGIFVVWIFEPCVNTDYVTLASDSFALLSSLLHPHTLLLHSEHPYISFHSLSEYLLWGSWPLLSSCTGWGFNGTGLTLIPVTLSLFDTFWSDPTKHLWTLELDFLVLNLGFATYDFDLSMPLFSHLENGEMRRAPIS